MDQKQAKSIANGDQKSKKDIPECILTQGSGSKQVRRVRVSGEVEWTLEESIKAAE
jgi:hypothetical protein